MTRFRQALLDELLARVADPVAEATPAPATSRVARLRRPGFALGGAVLAALAVGATVVVTQATSTPAYAVSTDPDGTVTVTVHFLGDPTAANRALQAAGVHARVILPSAPGACPPSEQGTPGGPFTGAQAMELFRSTVLSDQDGVVRLRPDRIPAGTVLVLVPMARLGRREPGLEVSWHAEPGPTCMAISPPPPVPGPIPTAPSFIGPVPTASAAPSVSDLTGVPSPAGSSGNTP
jgi:hypothetical protein